VFKLPSDPSTDYIKRIVGLPGDHLQVRHGELYINDQLVPRKEDPNCIDKEAGPFIVQLGYRESLPRASGGGAVQHCIIKEFGFGGREDGPLDNTPVYDVPADHYFAMGDNRDNSQDSRVLSAVGYIPNENLVGQAPVHLLLDRWLGALVGSLEMAVCDPLQPACSGAVS